MPLLKSSILKEDIKRGKKEQLREEQQSQKAIPWNHKYLSINNYFNVNKLNCILNYIIKRHRMNNKPRPNYMMGFPSGSESKESACNAGDLGSVGKIPWRREWLPTPVFLPGESHGQRSLVG